MATTAFKTPKNNIKLTLSASINAAATSIVLEAGEGASCPTVPYWMTLFEDDPDVNEVVLVTARSTDTLTVTRAQQGTVANSWSAGANVQLLFTAQALADVHTAVNNIETRIGDGTTDVAITAGNLTQTRSGAAIANVLSSYNGGASNLLEDFRISRGTSGTPVIVQNNDYAAQRFWGHDGSAWRQFAEIRAYINGTPGSSDMPGAIAVYVTPDGSATPGLALTIDQTKKATFAGAIEVTGAQTFTGNATFNGSITVPNDSFTYAKLQNVSATDKVLGRSTAGAGDIEEIAFTTYARQLCDDASFDAMLTTLGGAVYTGTGGLVRAVSPVFTGAPVVGDGTGNTDLYLNAASGSLARIRYYNGSTTANAGLRWIQWSKDSTYEWEIGRYNAGTYQEVALSINNTTGVVSITRALSQGVFALTDAATIATDASKGNIFDVTLGNNRTMGAPTNPINGQEILYRIRQDGTGSRTITWNSAFQFSTTYPSPTLTTTANRVDHVSFRYYSTDSKWHCTGINKNFA